MINPRNVNCLECQTEFGMHNQPSFRKFALVKDVALKDQHAGFGPLTIITQFFPHGDTRG